MKIAMVAFLVAVVPSLAATKLPPDENAARLRQLHPAKDNILTETDIKLGIWHQEYSDEVNLKTRPSNAQITAAYKAHPTLEVYYAATEHILENQNGHKPPFAFSEVDASVYFSLQHVPAKAPGTPELPGPGKAVATATATPAFQLGHFFLRRSLTKYPPGVGLPTDQTSLETADIGISTKAAGGGGGGSGSTGYTDTVKAELSQGAKKLIDDSALFSYTRDIQFSVDQWLAQGVLGYTQDLPINLPPFFVQDSLHTVLFGEFSRVDVGGNVQRIEKSLNVKTISNQINSSESNSLILGGSIWGRVPLLRYEKLDFTGLIFQIAAVDRTDFDFHSQIPDGEFELRPDIGRLGMGSANTACFPKYLAWRIDPTIHFDAGYVVDAGPWTKSKRGDSFVHLGPKLQLTLWPLYGVWPFTENPIVVTGLFAQYEALNSRSKEVRLAQVNTSFYLRKPPDTPSSKNPLVSLFTDSGIALTLSYQEYRNFENETDDDVFTVGLGFGF